MYKPPYALALKPPLLRGPRERRKLSSGKKKETNLTYLPDHPFCYMILQDLEHIQWERAKHLATFVYDKVQGRLQKYWLYTFRWQSHRSINSLMWGSSQLLVAFLEPVLGLPGEVLAGSNVTKVRQVLDTLPVLTFSSCAFCDVKGSYLDRNTGCRHSRPDVWLVRWSILLLSAVGWNSLGIQTCHFPVTSNLQLAFDPVVGRRSRPLSRCFGW